MDLLIVQMCRVRCGTYGLVEKGKSVEGIKVTPIVGIALHIVAWEGRSSSSFVGWLQYVSTPAMRSTGPRCGCWTGTWLDESGEGGCLRYKRR
jgi:hypothetical protein